MWGIRSRTGRNLREIRRTATVALRLEPRARPRTSTPRGHPPNRSNDSCRRDRAARNRQVMKRPVTPRDTGRATCPAPGWEVAPEGRSWPEGMLTAGHGTTVTTFLHPVVMGHRGPSPLLGARFSDSGSVRCCSCFCWEPAVCRWPCSRCVRAHRQQGFPASTCPARNNRSRSRPSTTQSSGCQ